MSEPADEDAAASEPRPRSDQFACRSAQPGDEIGGYRLLRYLGAGEPGRLFAAVHRFSKRKAAVKVLQLGWSRSRRALQHCQHEVIALCRIEHPNIVSVYQADVTKDGDVFIAMERLRGSTLRELLKRSGAIYVTDAVSLAVQVADGLTAAHEAGVIHRDVRPENIFCTNSGRIKLLDLGTAKLAREDRTTLDANEKLGTAAYAAPEDLSGAPADPRMDIYSLGLVLYEAIVGCHPLVPERDWPAREELARRQLQSDPSPLEQLPDGLWEAIQCAIQKDPEQRFRSTREFADALRAIVPRAEELSVRAPEVRDRRKRPRLSVGVAIGLGLVGGAMAVAIAVAEGTDRPAPGPPAAELESPPPPPQPLAPQPAVATERGATGLAAQPRRAPPSSPSSTTPLPAATAPAAAGLKAPESKRGAPAATRPATKPRAGSSSRATQQRANEIPAEAKTTPAASGSTQRRKRSFF
jgi:serine/threonine-protein kinase